MEAGKRQGSGVEVLSGGNCHEVGSDDLDNALRWFFEAGRIVPDVNNQIVVCMTNSELMLEEGDVSDLDMEDMLTDINTASKETVSGMSRLGVLCHITGRNVKVDVEKMVDGFDDGMKVHHIQGEPIGLISNSEYHLKLVVDELVKNSLEAIAKIENGTVSVMTGKRVLDDKDCFFIEVIDNGSGIPTEDREKVFYPNVRLGFKGMGLAVVYQTIKKVLGGRLFLSSKTGEDSYTKMTVVVPMEKMA